LLYFILYVIISYKLKGGIKMDVIQKLQIIITLDEDERDILKNILESEVENAFEKYGRTPVAEFAEKLINELD